ncbi:hypothetical protein GCM10018790_64230 [Kitasatospora xanthocidica]|nr:hypothetical protein GCM10018790_64230 [Kitasatospora xanthocidica]
MPCENDKTIHMLNGEPLPLRAAWPAGPHQHPEWVGSDSLGEHVSMGVGTVLGSWGRARQPH